MFFKVNSKHLILKNVKMYHPIYFLNTGKRHVKICYTIRLQIIAFITFDYSLNTSIPC